MTLAREMGPSLAAATIERVASYTKAGAGDYVGAFPHAREALVAFEALGHEDGRQQAALMHAASGAACGEVENPMPALVGAIEHARGRGDPYSAALGLIVIGEFARFSGDRSAAEEQYSAAIAILDGIQNIFWPGALRQNIGHFRVHDGAADEAAALFARSYDLADDYDYPIMLAVCVAGFAGVALLRGEDATAALLLGAVEKQLDRLGADFEPADKADVEGYVETAKAHLGEAAYAEHAAAGAREDWNSVRAKAEISRRIGGDIGAGAGASDCHPTGWAISHDAALAFRMSNIGNLQQPHTGVRQTRAFGASPSAAAQLDPVAIWLPDAFYLNFSENVIHLTFRAQSRR